MLRALLGNVLAPLVKARPGGPFDGIQRRRGLPPGQVDAALALQAAALASPSPPRWNAAGHALFEADRVDEALDAWARAFALDPANAQALAGLAKALFLQGRQAKAIDAFRRAVDLQPGDPGLLQSLAFAMLCDGEAGDAEIRAVHERFARRFEDPLKAGWAPHANTRDPGRRLRLGYLSADLRDHVTGRFLAPLLACHDRETFEIHLYHDSRLADGFTDELQAWGDAWHDMASLGDDALAAGIRADAIDVLVDLSGHTPGNRILALARKPAPVQVSYLDYSATTGLAAMDWRITTAELDPPGVADAFYTERLVRIPGSFWLYEPAAAPGTDPSAQQKDFILFSCLNSFYRVGDKALALWAEILRAVPGSRLALVGVPEGSAREDLATRMRRLGVDPGRLECFGLLNHGHYRRLVQATDVALGPFPYNGATTLMDCLWHGVPVVALAGGQAFRSRMAHCILPQVGLEDLLARDGPGYVEAAVGLARDAGRRARLRAELPQRFSASPLADAPALACALEDAFRSMWRHWCDAQP